jgi:Domain of unknown function (DUF1876)
MMVPAVVVDVGGLQTTLFHLGVLGTAPRKTSPDRSAARWQLPGDSIVVKVTASRSEEVFAMTTVDSWLVEIVIRERDRETDAEARLTKGAGGLTGHGTARRNPEDREATQIGEEIAAARALSDLAHKLLDAAAGDIEAITHQAARLQL